MDVNGIAVSGPDTVDARLVATEVLTGNPFVINGAVNPHQWLVQDRPLVVMDSVTVTPKIASAGQQNLSGRVIITNQTGVYRATARLDSVDINFLLVGCQCGYELRDQPDHATDAAVYAAGGTKPGDQF